VTKRTRIIALAICAVSRLPRGVRCSLFQNRQVPQEQQKRQAARVDSSLFHDVDHQRHRSMAFATKVRALAIEMARLRWCQRYFAVLTLFDLGDDMQIGDFQAVSHIRAMKNEDDSLALLQSDLVGAV